MITRNKPVAPKKSKICVETSIFPSLDCASIYKHRNLYLVNYFKINIIDLLLLVPDKIVSSKYNFLSSEVYSLNIYIERWKRTVAL